jgi:hypothetical protein
MHPVKIAKSKHRLSIGGIRKRFKTIHNIHSEISAIWKLLAVYDQVHSLESEGYYNSANERPQ